MSLSFHDCAELFGKILDGALPPPEVREMLLYLADKGETADEIAGAASAMRARMLAVQAPADAIDVCGTGGDGSHSLNVSTAVALVVAACEVPVAKHGNRAASSKAGGADTLEALGLNLTRASDTAEDTLNDLGICFLFAQKHHPALASIAPIRREIGRRTIFNYLGPLCNPGRVTRQLVGVPAPGAIEPYARAMAMLGSERAMVVSGAEGLDEISISSPTHCETIGMSLPSNIITPNDARLPLHPAEALNGGNPSYNAKALKRLLDGESGAYRDAVLLNASAALLVAGHVADLRDGVEEAAEAIDKGLVKTLLDCWIQY